MKEKRDIWVLADHDRSFIDESAFGLIHEARRILSDIGGQGLITAVVMGTIENDAMTSLREGGADRIIHIRHDFLNRYHGEIFAKIIYEIAEKENIFCILFAHNDRSMDFSARLAARLNSALINRAMDLRFDEENKGIAIRPVSNGYLFEMVTFSPDPAPVITFIPSVLSDVNNISHDYDTQVEVIVPEIEMDDLKTKAVNIIEAAPEDLNVEEADIIVAAGRGAGKGDDFDKIHELAENIGGSVGGTRPVIDLKLLPFERQIGQTGKTVSPDLIINCGISGANEYSAGMEKSKKVISINKDPRARIFRFSDLGVVGDLHEIIPMVIEKIKERKG